MFNGPSPPLLENSPAQGSRPNAITLPVRQASPNRPCVPTGVAHRFRPPSTCCESLILLTHVVDGQVLFHFAAFLIIAAFPISPMLSLPVVSALLVSLHQVPKQPSPGLHPRVPSSSSSRALKPSYQPPSNAMGRADVVRRPPLRVCPCGHPAFARLRPHHRRHNLRLSSPPLHDLRANAPHRSSGLLLVVPLGPHMPPWRTHPR
jgi:hypothetical protein